MCTFWSQGKHIYTSTVTNWVAVNSTLFTLASLSKHWCALWNSTAFNLLSTCRISLPCRVKELHHCYVLTVICRSTWFKSWYFELVPWNEKLGAHLMGLWTRRRWSHAIGSRLCIDCDDSVSMCHEIFQFFSTGKMCIQNDESLGFFGFLKRKYRYESVAT